MKLEEIQAANEAADKEREALMKAEAMQEGLKEEVTLSPEATEEEKKQHEAELLVKARQQTLVDVVKELVESLIQDKSEFTVDELGWATEAFKNLLTIRTTATREHEELSKVLSDAQGKFYAMKAKDLTTISYEVVAGKDETAKE